MVDTGVTGHLDDAAYLGAVAVGSAIFGFLYTGVNFLRMGTTGITAQRFGADDYDGVRVALGQAVIVALTIALGLILIQVPIFSAAVRLMGGDAAVSTHASEYLAVRIWSAPATLCGYALIGWFIGLQDARIPLAIVLVTNTVNVILDLWFVIGLGMKVKGVAAASVMAEYTGLAIALWFVRRELRRHAGVWLTHKFTRFAEYRAFISINANLFMRTVALVATFTFVTAQGARLGGLVLAANAVLMNFQTLLAFALDGLAHAAEALVGRAVGSDRPDALERAVSLTLRWSLCVALAFCALFYVGGPLLIAALTDLPEVRDTTLTYLPWMVLSPIVSVWPFLYDGVFVGATRARDMRNSMVFSALCVFLPSWYAFRFLGNHGLWLAFMIFMASRGLTMHLLYRRKIA